MGGTIRILAEITEEAKNDFFEGYDGRILEGEVFKEDGDEMLIVFPDGDTRMMNRRFIKQTREVPAI